MANNDKCNSLKSGCTNNGANACGDRTCANATNVPQASYTPTICDQWKSGCVPNAANSGC